MANNYTQSSSFLPIPPEKLERAASIIQQTEHEICIAQSQENQEDIEYCSVGCDTEVREGGVWIYGEEHFNPDHAENIARALVELLELDIVFACSWAYTCDKPRHDEFGGGAFCLKRGAETVWCDALSFCREQARQLGRE